jgi:hypothetical protein
MSVGVMEDYKLRDLLVSHSATVHPAVHAHLVLHLRYSPLPTLTACILLSTNIAPVLPLT